MALTPRDIFYQLNLFSLLHRYGSLRGQLRDVMPPTSPSLPSPWTPSDLSLLVVSLHISHATPPYNISLVPPNLHRHLPALLSHLLPDHPDGTLTQRLQALLRLFCGRPSLAPPHPPCPRRGRLAIRLIPNTAEDFQRVHQLKYPPHLELLLRGKRPVWTVIHHLWKKWELPVKVYQGNNAITDVGRPLFGLQVDKDSVALLRYQILNTSQLMTMTQRKKGRFGKRKRTDDSQSPPRSKTNSQSQTKRVALSPQPVTKRLNFGGGRVLSPGHHPSSTKPLAIKLGPTEILKFERFGTLVVSKPDHIPPNIQHANINDPTAPGQSNADDIALLNGEKEVDEITAMPDPEESTKGSNQNEIKVMERLKGHLRRLGNGEDVGAGVDSTGKESTTEAPATFMNAASRGVSVIPDMFLNSRTGYTMNLPVQLPDGLLSGHQGIQDENFELGYKNNTQDAGLTPSPSTNVEKHPSLPPIGEDAAVELDVATEKVSANDGEVSVDDEKKDFDSGNIEFDREPVEEVQASIRMMDESLRLGSFNLMMNSNNHKFGPISFEPVRDDFKLSSLGAGDLKGFEIKGLSLSGLFKDL